MAMTITKVMSWRGFTAFLLGALTCVACTGQETGVAQVPSLIEPTAPQNRWLLLCCGLPGDDPHRERLTDACEKIMTAAQPVLGVTPDRLRVFVGDESMQQYLSATHAGVGICTQESTQAGLKDLIGRIPKEDSCWVIMIGHAFLYGTNSQFNVRDQDFNQKQFAEWVKPLACREQVFLLTFPVSGFWMRPLRSESRVIVTATEAGLEYTGTEMPYALADILAGEGEHAGLEDIDGDGLLSLLDLYLGINLEIDGRFKSIERLQTEHAQLDDNGDGRGKEVQLPYLPVDPPEPDESEAPEGAEQDDEDTPQMAEPKLPPPITNPLLDGFRSRSIVIDPLVDDEDSSDSET